MNEQAEPLVIDGWNIDPLLLAPRAIGRCSHDVCKAACCADGVWLDMAQAQSILDNAAVIAPYMPAERRNPATWFSETYDDDPAYPSGIYTGTNIVADPDRPGMTSCIFLRPADRYCAVQAATSAAGDSPWRLKPLYCCLYPLIDEYSPDGRVKKLTLDIENPLFEQGGGCRQACALVQPVFQVYAEEIALVLGIEGYRELCRRMSVTPRM